MNAKSSLRTSAIIALGASLAIFQPQASFAALVYSEAVSGDLPGDQNHPLLIGSFASGTNTVTGHDSIDSDTALGQGDGFGLTLSAGQHIDSIGLTISSNRNDGDAFTLTIFQSPFTQVDQQVLSPGGSGLFTFAPFATQSPGQYNFSIQAETGNQPANGFDWQWDIHVVGSAVPEPSTWAMLMIGFAAIGGLAYRRSRRAGAPALV
ncbi:MAG: PEPxxWA-CTERM sorting domain-containing protein [Roseiarcus sp.]